MLAGQRGHVPATGQCQLARMRSAGMCQEFLTCIFVSKHTRLDLAPSSLYAVDKRCPVHGRKVLSPARCRTW